MNRSAASTKSRIRQFIAALPKVLPREGLIAHPDCRVYEEFGSPERVSLPGADLITSSNPEWIADNLSLWKADWPRPFVCVIEDATVLGRLYIGLTKSREIILETTRTAGPKLLWPKITRQTVWSYLRTIVRAVPSLGDGLWAPLFQASQDCYFDWYCEVLSIVEAVRVIESKLGRRVRFVVSRPLREWQRETLALLDVKEEDIVCWNGTAVRVPGLVVASVRTDGWTCLPSIAALRQIRDQMLPRIVEGDQEGQVEGEATPRYIYVRRSGRRRIENEDELLLLLESRGIVPIELEGMAVSDQIRLFKGAKLIVGAHGAGLTNLIFCDHAEVVEIFGTWKGLCFATIALGFGHGYTGVDFMPTIGFQTAVADQSTDFPIDIDRLLPIIDQSMEKVVARSPG